MKELRSPVVRKWGDHVMVLYLGVLFIIMIFAVLPLRDKKDHFKTERRLRAIQTGLTQFKAEYGSYPICEDPKEGGKIIYMCLFGDFNLNGMPDHFPADEHDLDVKTFVEKLRPPGLDEEGNPIGPPTWVAPAEGGGWKVVDLKGRQLYYYNPRPGNGLSINAHSYDLGFWEGDGPICLLESSEDTEAKNVWIKNW